MWWLNIQHSELHNSLWNSKVTFQPSSRTMINIVVIWWKYWIEMNASDRNDNIERIFNFIFSMNADYMEYWLGPYLCTDGFQSIFNSIRFFIRLAIIDPKGVEHNMLIWTSCVSINVVKAHHGMVDILYNFSSAMCRFYFISRCWPLFLGFILKRTAIPMPFSSDYVDFME